MPSRLCLSPSCPNTAHHRGYCKGHARAKERRTNRAGRAIYNKARWKNTRKAVLSANPLCPCGEIAVDVHHKVDIADGGDPWSMSNLIGLCKRCHGIETRRGQQTA